MSTVGTFVANGHGQDYGNAAVQQTLYAVVEAFSCLKVWTRLYGNYVNSEHFVANGQVARRQLRRQWALCRERSERVRRALGKCQLRKRVWDGRPARGDAAWKLAVRAAPIVKPSCFKSIKPSCFKSIRRLPGTIKVGGRAKQRFIPPKPVGLLQHREKLGLSCLSFVRGSMLLYDARFRTNPPAGFS